MKKCILLFSLFTIQQVIAQPIMNKLYDFQIGHVYSYKKVSPGWKIDTSFIQTSGTNITWNFDTITLLPTIFSDSILSPANTLGTSSFSNADFVWKEYSGTLQYYRKNLDTVFYMGHYTFWPTLFTPNPITCVANTALSPNYFYSNFQTNVSGNGTWTYDARYNASGTLKLPGVTHNNVGLYITVGGTTTKYADYFWFKENQNDPVLRIQFVWNNSSSTVQYLYVNTKSLQPTNIENLPALEVHISPNPAIDNLIAEAPFSIQQYEIINSIGQLLRKENINNNKATIDIEDLNKGIYFIRITDLENKSITQKFIK